MMKCKVVVLSLMSLAFFSCRKDEDSAADEIISPTTGTRMEFTLDSIYLYARQVYRWYEALPAYSEFDPRGRYGAISPEIAAFRTELYDISQLAVNANTGLPYESPFRTGIPRYSYLEQGSGTSTATASTASTASASDAIAAASLLEVEGHRVAYLALNSFPKLSDCRQQLDDTFVDFAAAAPQHIIVDLRSNGGGYVETAEHVANLIVPSTISGRTMYSERFNALMQAGSASMLKYQPYLDSDGNTVTYQGRMATMADVDYGESANTHTFSKAGELEGIGHVYFIVSGSTASASEMLISSLMPHLPVTLVGESTYGKPVGFFAINIDVYHVYLSSFTIHNAAGWGDYFEGMPVDVPVALSAATALGDPEEAALEETLGLISQNTDAAVQVKRLGTTSTTPVRSLNAGAPLMKQQFSLK